MQAPPERQQLAFGGLTIAFDDRVLRPRPWTQAQSRWAAELADAVPDGPALELCAGAGHIGLLLAALTTRALVIVDASEVACAYASDNAAAAGLADRVEVRHCELAAALEADERFPLILADPPWVASGQTGRFPEDPTFAIDGGPDGLDAARACIVVIARHLADGGASVLQLGTQEQVDRLSDEVAAQGLRVLEVRAEPGFDGVLVALSHDPHRLVPFEDG